VYFTHTKLACGKAKLRCVELRSWPSYIAWLVRRLHPSQDGEG
jgi:hypothetical protein